MNITPIRRSTAAAAAPHAFGPREPDEFSAARPERRQTPDFLQHQRGVQW